MTALRTTNADDRQPRLRWVFGREPSRRRRNALVLLCGWLAVAAAIAAHADPPTPPAIAHIPWTDAAEIARSPFGSGPEFGAIGKPLETVSTRQAEVRGVGISVPNDGRVRGSVATHCYVGVRLGSADARVIDTDSFNHRDACLWIARDAGNCQSTGCHFYGARVAVYNAGGWQYRSTSDTIADSQVGSLVDAQSTFTGCMWQHNTVRDCVVRGGGCRFVGCTFNVQRETIEQNEFNVPGLPAYSGKAGLEIVGGRCSLDASTIDITNWIHPAQHASGKPATGVIVAADQFRFEGKLIDSDGLDGTTGILVVGQRAGIHIDCDVVGFDQPHDRVLVVKEKCQINATFRAHGTTPKIEVAPGCTGRVVFEMQ